MPRHRTVPTLECLSVSAVGSYVISLAPEILSTIDVRRDPQATLQQSIDCLNDMLITHVPLYLYDDTAVQVLKSVKVLIERTKKSYVPYISMSTFMTEMNVAVSLTEVVLNKHLRQIDFSSWPKIMRYVLYKNLYKLVGLEVLNLGSCTTGGSEYDRFITHGLFNMPNLRSLCLCFDATDLAIQLLSENCPNLAVLDITSSRSVTDRSVAHLLKCTQLYELQLHRTSISIEGFAEVLKGLDRLRDVGRFDEFGAVLAHVAATSPKSGPFALRKIQCRELTTQHLNLLVDYCPRIENLSLFQVSEFPNLRVLVHLDELTSLKLLSSDFYSDFIRDLLEIRGNNLTSLHFEHVEQIDLNALIDISQYCPRLKNLVLYNCDLLDQAAGYSHRSFKVKPFQCLERLLWVVDCALLHLEFVLTHCHNVKYIHLGSSTGICHASIVKILQVNPMRELEILRILYSNDMSIETVDLLLANCPNIKVLSELENWQGISMDELKSFRKYIKSHNYDLDTTPILSQSS